MITSLASLALAGLGIVSTASTAMVPDTPDHPYEWDAIVGHYSRAADLIHEKLAQPAPWMRLWRGNETVVLTEPEWVNHRVTPGERSTQIATRYGVKPEQLRLWNRNRGRFAVGEVVRVHARRIPVPREKLVHVARSGETWGSIASDYRVEARDLHAYNPGVRALVPGTQLDIWYDPGEPWTVGRRLGQRLELPVLVGDGADSVGHPNSGRLSRGVRVPQTPFFERRNPNVLWGSTHAISTMISSFGHFRYDTGYDGTVLLTSMSREKGRYFPPHVSHQSGRDVDITLPVLPGVEMTFWPNEDQVDWYATWGLIRAMLDSKDVVYVFLDTALQRRLYEAARVMGESHEDLTAIIEWAAGHRRGTVIRHENGHANHLHVRFTCGSNESRCSGLRLDGSDA